MDQKKTPKPFKGLDDGHNFDLITVKLNIGIYPVAYYIFHHNMRIGVVPVFYVV